jgi:CRISPR-associated protein Cas1
MTVMYIDRRDADLEHEAGAVVLRVAGERVASLPLAGAERIVLRRAGMISARLLAELGARRIGLLVLGGRKGDPMAHLLGLPHGDAAIRYGQMKLATDLGRSVQIARLAVRGKIRGHLALVTDIGARRPDIRKPLFDARAELLRALEEIGSEQDLAALRGREGAAAAAFFRGFCAMFPPSLGFTGRNRRPPRDPVNACLSLGYTLLHAEAVRAAWVAGLDPSIGFLHALLPGRESLACDLVELSRPAIDRFVQGLFAERSLRVEHFSEVDGACLLGKTGRATFYELYEAMIPGERRRLRIASGALAREARAAWAHAGGRGERE